MKKTDQNLKKSLKRQQKFYEFIFMACVLITIFLIGFSPTFAASPELMYVPFDFTIDIFDLVTFRSNIYWLLPFTMFFGIRAGLKAFINLHNKIGSLSY